MNIFGKIFKYLRHQHLFKQYYLLTIFFFVGKEHSLLFLIVNVQSGFYQTANFPALLNSIAEAFKTLKT